MGRGGVVACNIEDYVRTKMYIVLGVICCRDVMLKTFL